MGDAAERLEQPEPILSVKCSEPDGEVVRHVRLCEYSFKNLRFLWEKLSEFDVLFNDHSEGDFGAFLRTFITKDEDGNLQPAGLSWQVDDVGLFYLTDIHPGHSALAHLTFWDRRLRGREELVREMLRHVFDVMGFHRVRVEVPLYARPVMSMVERIGFTKEGRAREAVKYKGEWFDVNLYSILETEV